eukprot:4507952-Prymnesium_polylepis.1
MVAWWHGGRMVTPCAACASVGRAMAASNRARVARTRRRDRVLEARVHQPEDHLGGREGAARRLDQPADAVNIPRHVRHVCLPLRRADA